MEIIIILFYLIAIIGTIIGICITFTDIKSIYIPILAIIVGSMAYSLDTTLSEIYTGETYVTYTANKIDNIDLVTIEKSKCRKRKYLITDECKLLYKKIVPMTTIDELKSFE